MKKIIVPIDFSEYSEFALETASALAKKYNAEILALHMLEFSKAVIASAENTNETLFYIKLAEKKFNTFLDKDYLKGVSVTPIVKHFKVFNEMNDVAELHQADLIIMGSHGTGGIKELFLGSNTEKVVRHSEVPVLVVKHSPILTDFENIVYACDFNDNSVESFKKVLSFSKSINAKIHLVYVNLPDYRFKSTSEIELHIADFFKQVNGHLAINDVTFVNDYSIEKGIINYANAIGADLIAVATHGRTGLMHFFEGSVSEDIANHSTLPVITFKM